MRRVFIVKVVLICVCGDFYCHGGSLCVCGGMGCFFT